MASNPSEAVESKSSQFSFEAAISLKVCSQESLPPRAARKTNSSDFSSITTLSTNPYFLRSRAGIRIPREFPIRQSPSCRVFMRNYCNHTSALFKLNSAERVLNESELNRAEQF